MNELSTIIGICINEEIRSASLLVDITQINKVDLDERFCIKEEKGLTVYLVNPGGYIESHVIREDLVEVPRVDVGFHVVEFVDKVRTNPQGIIGSVTKQGIKQLHAVLSEMVFSIIRSAVPEETPITLGHLVSEISFALSEVRDTSKGPLVRIVGRAPVVDRLRKEPGWCGESFEGARTVTITNYEISPGQTWVQPNELFVISPLASHAVFFGPAQVIEWIDNAADEWHLKAKQPFGFIIHQPSFIKRFKVTNMLTPPWYRS